MPAGEQLSNEVSAPTNGHSTPHELFALTDEQILEIEPEGEAHVAPDLPAQAGEPRTSSLGANSAPRTPSSSEGPSGQAATNAAATQHGSQDTSHQSPVTSHDSPEPPPWLAAQMKDSWSGEEARELWNGLLQARQEAAAYRAAFATPEDARVLKELYPGGVNEARAAADRARLLNEIDHAYFGVLGGSAEQASATRADLAQRMLREDPAAFREMVFAGLRALEEAEKGSGGAANAATLPRLAQVFASNRAGADAAPPFRVTSSITDGQPHQDHAAVTPGPTQVLHESPITSHESHLSAYVAFEKAANDDLERSVGAAIERTLRQALPNLHRGSDSTPAGARSSVPLQGRLSAAVRQDVEAGLKGDRQLGDQIAQILSARRFDNETRAQVVRLIDDRARQLVPSAAKRVLNDWTQTTFAAHRGNASRSDAASARRQVEATVAEVPSAPGESARRSGQQLDSPAAFSSRVAQTRSAAEPQRNAPRSVAHRVDYRKLSDEQILEL